MESTKSPATSKLTAVEQALDRRINHHGMVEYLVKEHNTDKMEWVPWTNIYCPQLMDPQAEFGHPHCGPDSAHSQSTGGSDSATGVIDI